MKAHKAMKEQKHGMKEHKQDMTNLKKGFHSLIKDIQQQKMDQFLTDLDRKMDRKISVLEGKKQPPAKAALTARISSLENKIQSLEASKPIAAEALNKKITTLEKSLKDKTLAQDIQNIAKRLSLVETQDTQKPSASAGDLAALKETLRSVRKELSNSMHFQDSQKKLTPKINTLMAKTALLEAELRKPPSLKSVFSELAALQAKILALEKESKKPIPHPKPPSHQPLINRLNSLGDRLMVLEKEIQKPVHHPRPPSLEPISDDLISLRGKVSVLEKTLERHRKQVAKEDLDSMLKSMYRLSDKVLALERESKKPVHHPKPPSHQPLINRLNSLGEKLAALEKEIQKPVHHPITDLRPVFQKIDGLNSKLVALESQETEHTGFTNDLADLGRKFALLEQKSMKPVHHPKPTSLEPAFDRIAALDKKISILKKELGEPIPHPKPPSLRPVFNSVKTLGRRINRLERATSASSKQLAAEQRKSILPELSMLGRRLSAIEEQNVRGVGALQKESAMLRKKVAGLETAQSTLSKELGESVPTRKLLDVESKMKSDTISEKRTMHKTLRLLGSVEVNAKKRDNHLTKSVSHLKAGLETSLKDLAMQLETAKREFSVKLDEKETDIMNLVSSSDSLISKKLNAQFLKWLANLEHTAKERIDSNLEQLEKIQHELDSLRRGSVKKKDMEEMEEQLLGPMEALDMKIKKFVRQEVEKLHHDLKKSQSLEKIDHKTLQEEINRIVREMERQRTYNLESELSKLVEESERIKKTKR